MTTYTILTDASPAEMGRALEDVISDDDNVLEIYDKPATPIAVIIPWARYCELNRIDSVEASVVHEVARDITRDILR